MVWVTSLGNLFKFNDLVFLFKMGKLTVFKTQNFKKQKNAVDSHTVSSLFGKKNMAKYKMETE